MDSCIKLFPVGTKNMNFYLHRKVMNFSLRSIWNSQLVVYYALRKFSNKASTPAMVKPAIKIGCASGFWGDTPTATSQLIQSGNVDFIIYDYLSELTMSLLTAAKAKNPELGYAPDFISHAVGPHLQDLKRKGIRVVSNAGGINPQGCAAALRKATKSAGVDLKIGVVSGDDLIYRKKEYIGTKDIITGIPLPNTIHSMNAYLGSEQIVQCLNHGADIVVTGRCTDSALALAPLIHSFGWKMTDFDRLSSGSLAGHLIECGAQVTGGIFTDWEKVNGWDNIGFPIAEVSENGDIFITKPRNTGGLISTGTVSEQMLYEIGNPKSYILPDVVCDFTKVKLEEVDNGVRVSGALGKPPTDSYKVCTTYMDGFKATAICCVGGQKSGKKARKTAEAILTRCRNLFQTLNIKDFKRTNLQVLGNEDTYGSHATPGNGPREAVLWLSVHHDDKKALQLFSMEVASAGTGMGPGLTAIVGGRPKVIPLLRLHSFIVNKNIVVPKTEIDGNEIECAREAMNLCVNSDTYKCPDQLVSEISKDLTRGSERYTLQELAFCRSGDKGDSCNIGVIARKPSFLPYIQEALTKEAVAKYFAHLFPNGVDPVQCVKRYELEGISALNFVLENSLGGGGIASLRSDPLGKALGQMLLDYEITNMPNINSL